MADRENVPKRTARFRRSMLVREVCEFEVEIPADYDVGEWMENDFAGLDEFVRGGRLIRTDYESINGDVDELDIEEVARPTREAGS